MDPVRVPLLRPLRPAQLVAIDCAATALLALASAVIFREAAYLPGIPRWAAALVIAAGVLPAAFRRRWPRSVLALVVLSAAVATAISTSPGPVLAVAFVIYLTRCGGRAGRRCGCSRPRCWPSAPGWPSSSAART